MNVFQISHVLQTVAKKESIFLPDALAVALARESDRNARRALLMLEAAHVQTRGATGGGDNDGGNGVEGVLKEDQALPTTDWELYIQNLAVDITREQSPQRLLAAREKLYELLVNCIPASVIIKRLTEELIKNLDDSLKLQVLEWAAFYEHRISLGSKEIFHLEAFVAKYMAIYKKYLNDLFA
jgi:replication factor C subunit 3/5